MVYSRNERGRWALRWSSAVRMKDRRYSDCGCAWGQPWISHWNALEIWGGAAGNEAGYTRVACLAAPQQFAFDYQRITSPLPYVESLRWWVRRGWNVETGEASTLLGQRLVVGLDENLDGLFVGADLDTDGLVAKKGDTC
jgi:hypothetical protein